MVTVIEGDQFYAGGSAGHGTRTAAQRADGCRARRRNLAGAQRGEPTMSVLATADLFIKPDRVAGCLELLRAALPDTRSFRRLRAARRVRGPGRAGSRPARREMGTAAVTRTTSAGVRRRECSTSSPISQQLLRSSAISTRIRTSDRTTQRAFGNGAYVAEPATVVQLLRNPAHARDPALRDAWPLRPARGFRITDNSCGVVGIAVNPPSAARASEPLPYVRAELARHRCAGDHHHAGIDRAVGHDLDVQARSRHGRAGLA